MANKKKYKVEVQGKEIVITNIGDEDYISLTDMAAGEGRPALVIANWIRNKDTIEFLGTWERLYNPKFKVFEFEDFLNRSGSNRFAMSPSDWISTTAAIGIISKSGRGGGTFAHRDIAFEFGSWISPTFRLLLIREFQRLKEEEYSRLNQHWDFSRFLSKVNYSIQAQSIRDHILPRLDMPKEREGIVYASEADILNLALFGVTAKQWREANPEAVKAGRNIRDGASIPELTVLANLEAMNAQLIKNGASKEARLVALVDMARYQLEILASDFRLQEVERNQPLPEPDNSEM